MIYRPEIDGLRAIAVSLVLVYHAFPHLLTGGFVGVDVFFVISGYLITHMILQEQKDKRFSVLNFYCRRIARIFPALIIVLVSAFILGWIVLLPKEFIQVGKHILAGAGFFTNFLLWQESGYFDQETRLKPLMHLWSLAIEEQFYIIFPLILYVLSGQSVKRAILIALLLLMSLMISALPDLTNAYRFFLPHTRLWELLIGSICALLLHDDRKKINSNIKLLIVFSGLCIILACAILYDASIEFPGLWALPVTIGTALIILSGLNNPPIQKTLGNKLFVYIGLISYPLYLWHWLLLSYAHIYYSGMPGNTRLVFALILSIALSALTYHFVEKPIRKHNKKTNVALFLCLTLILVASLGYFTIKQSGFPSRLASEMRILDTIGYKPDTKLIGMHCLRPNEEPETALSYSAESCIEPASPIGNKHAPIIALWGDSHAQYLFPGIYELRGQRDYRLALFRGDSCPPLDTEENENCRKLNKNYLAQIQKIKPETVILFAVWSSYVEKNEETLLRNKILKTVESLRQIGIKNIIVIGPPPQWKISLPILLSNFNRDNLITDIPLFMTEGVIGNIRHLDSELKKNLNVDYISAWEVFCSEIKGCMTHTDKGNMLSIVTWDTGHLTHAGAKHLAQKIPIWN